MRLAIALSALALLAAGWTSSTHAPSAPKTSDEELLVGRPWIDDAQLQSDARLSGYFFADQPLEDDLFGIFFHAHRYVANTEVFEYKSSEKRLEFHFPTGHERTMAAYVVKHEKHGDFDISLSLSMDPERKGAAKKYWSKVEWEESKTCAPLLPLYRQMLRK